MKFVFLSALLVIPAAISAQQHAAPAAAPVSSNKPAKPHKPGDTIICRTDDEIGSHVIKKKICMTADQWHEQSAELGGAMNQRTPGGN